MLLRSAFLCVFWVCLLAANMFGQVEGQFRPSIHQRQAEFYNNLGQKSEAEWDALSGRKPEASTEKVTACSLTHSVYGWYPYWMGTSYTGYDFTKLSTFCYFSYDVNPTTGGYNSIHSWRTTNSIPLAQAAGCRVELCATNFGSTNNTNFLTNAVAKQTFIDSIISLLQYRNADGVNIDFEGLPGAQRNNFTAFMQNLSTQVKNAIPGASVSMALYAVDWGNVFNIPALDPYVDEFVIMGYDYYYSGSAQAGPNSPLYSGTLWAPYNLTKSVNYYLGQGVTPTKLLTGLPYYGEEWNTAANTYPSTNTGHIAARLFNYMENNYAGIRPKTFDVHSQTPVYIWQSAGLWRQCWGEDVQSMAEKFDLIHHRNLGGIGIWALGYDDGHPDFWNLITQKFTDCGPDICADTLWDTGGPMGNYANNENYKFTIHSPNGEQIKAEFIAFNLEANYDYVYIYDGPSTASPLIGQYSGTTIPPVAISSGTAMTFRFTTDGATVASGYQLKWACEGAPMYGDTIRLDHNAFGNIDCGKPYHVFYDSDAGVAGNYLNNERNTMTFCASDPAKSVRLNFNMLVAPVQLDLVSSTVGNDYFWVWDGADTTTKVKALYTGSTAAYPQPGTIISSGRCLTTRLQSDAITTGTGFKATLRCANRPTVNPTLYASAANPLNFYDTGGALGNYGNNESYVVTYCPDGIAMSAGQVIHAQIGAVGLEQNYDYLHVYDGNSTNARLIATYTGNALNQNDLQTIKATIANASGCLTFEFSSDGGTVASGWAATIRSGAARKNYGSNDCSSATLINASSVAYTGSTTLATGKPTTEDPNLNIQLLSLPQCNGANAITRLENTVWYKFSTPSTICTNGQIDMQLENISCQNSIPGGNGAQIAIYQVNACQSGASWGAPIYCADKMLQSAPVNIAPLLQPSQTYYVMVDGFAGQHCNLDLMLTGDLNGCILPIELVSFSGTEMEGFVQLDWQTYAEENNVGFFVEWMLANSSNTFQEIGFVPSSPDVQGAGAYALQHPDYARNAINYYRLRQLDSNGTSHYHRVIEVRPGQSGDVLAPVLFPNPFQNAITIRFESLSSEAGSVELFDLQGREIFQSDWAKDQQPEELVIETERFAAGVYVYRILVGGKVFAGKVVRE
jgi:spore germination protein YaaH